jgi:hypothetical protein
VQESVLKAGALHLDEIGELEHPLEGTVGDALIEHLAALLFILGVFLAADGQGVLLRDDRQFRLVKTGYRDRDAIGVFAVRSML